MDQQAHVVTEVSAHISPEREAQLLEGFRALALEPFPEGLLHSALLSDGDGRWKVHTTWRDQASLTAMRSTGQPPAALRLFRSVGAEPTVAIWQVAATLTPPETPDP
ncbi:hypothetical protein GCM10011374_40540 [Kocuria dechangensis]|uniref:Antibiotic biosynthesis monooxygenase n=1 Tax=Kocuria dechangensis TaxID=1176249 RepID=A0A917M0R3_9MICC|nr:hypothetical protein [Kocuria dechangensis]GGG71702.1 hypothetical protein GCM10011374_40540 [Kocuria dechangensis]